MTNVLHPVREVKIGDEKVEVRELRWKEASAFLASLGQAIARILDKDGQFTPSVQSFQALIAESTELTESLVIKATGKESEWLGQQRAQDVITLLDVALELNVSPEIIDRGKKLVERVRGAFGVNSTPRPSPA